jgi:hypothetical protein
MRLALEAIMAGSAVLAALTMGLATVLVADLLAKWLRDR